MEGVQPRARSAPRWVGIGLAVLSASVALAGCDGSSTPGTQANLATTGNVVSAPRNGISAATLDVANGATQIDVATSALGGALLRVASPSGSPQRPSVDVNGNQVTVTLVDSPGGSGTGGLSLALEADVVWTVRIKGGSTTLNVDTRVGGVRELDLLAGASTMDLALGVPVGTVTVTVRGGASALNLRRPASVPLRVRGAGVGSLTVDGVRQSPGGSLNRATPGWDASSARYDLDVESGIGALTVEGSGG